MIFGIRKLYQIFWLIGLGFTFSFSQSFPDFLVGEWKVEGKEKYEKWQKVDDGRLAGSLYKIVEGKNISSEYLEIKKINHKIIYTATVPAQNEGKGIDFVLNLIGDKKFSFENKNHDFPKKIIYNKINDDSLFIEVFGENDEGFSFNMSRVKTELGLGKFSMSLAVKDIKASKEFYEKLGFSALPGAGGVEQKWLIMMHDEIKIGLFQGFFPENTLTFNPKNGRAIFKQIDNHGIKPVFSTGLDNVEGPCSFSIIDPDGNSILIDQY